MEIVVLDNASHDGAIEMLRDEFPGVVVRAENTRRGFGANQNRAIAISRGELVFMLNPDATVEAGTIDALVQAMQRDERVVAAGCRVLNSDGTERQGGPIPFPTPLRIYAKAFGLGRFLSSRRFSTRIFGNRWLSGGAMLVDRQTFLEIGGFDESFFMYSEDVDLCKRLLATDRLFTWVPQASVVHPLPKESGTMLQRRQHEIVKAELSYIRKYHGKSGQHVYRLGAGLDSAFRVLVLGLPGISRVVQVHGASSADTRDLHLTRLQAVVRPTTGEGLSELALRWNSRPAEPTPSPPHDPA
jgi:GT2 family glycosyltransferase